MVFQAVPNFSEGIVESTLQALRDAALAGGADLRDWSADIDHNRSVYTLIGGAGAISASIVRMAIVAVECIDMNYHRGVHPRIGAIDVLPIVPLSGASMNDAIALADEIAKEIAFQLKVPIYLYEQSARNGRRNALPEIRGGGYEALAGHELTGVLEPDYGPKRTHPTAGATVCGARSPLVACNVNLDTDRLEIAQAIASGIRKARQSDPRLDGVRALGLLLAHSGQAQVSLNLTKPGRTPLHQVFDYVQAEAERLGAKVFESEIIGVIPPASLAGMPPERILWRAYKPSQILKAEEVG